MVIGAQKPTNVNMPEIGNAAEVGNDDEWQEDVIDLVAHTP